MRGMAIAVAMVLPSALIPPAIASGEGGKAKVVSREAVALKWVKEEIAGDGTKGPFVLGWSEIVPGSEGVYISGRRLLAGHDYAIDYGTGVIVFSEPLPKGEKAEVYYAYRPGLSRKNSKKRPLEAAAWSISPGMRLGVAFVPGEGGARASGAALSLASEVAVGRRGRATAVLAVSPQAGPSGTAGSVPPEAYAVRSGWSTAVGGLSLRAEVERVGRRFRGPGRWGVRPGGERMALSTEAPLLGGAGRARLAIERIEQGRSEHRRLGFETTALLAKGLKATLRREALGTKTGKAEAERVKQEVKVEQSLGRATKAAMALRKERVGKTEREEREIEVSTVPSAGLTLRGGLAVAESSGGSEREERRLEARLGRGGLGLRAAVKGIEAGGARAEVREVEAKTKVGEGIEASLSLKEREAPTGTERARAASVALAPSPKLRLSGRVVESPSRAERAVRAEVRPSPSLSLFAARILRREGKETQELGVSIKPLRSAKVEARYAHLPVRKGKVLPEERYELSLSIPVGLGWRLGGRHIRRVELATGGIGRRTELSLLKPLGRARKLRLGLSLAERALGAEETRAYELRLGYVHEFTSTFGLSLEGKMRRESFGGMLSEPYYQAEVKFRLLY